MRVRVRLSPEPRRACVGDGSYEISICGVAIGHRAGNLAARAARGAPRLPPHRANLVPLRAPPPAEITFLTRGRVVNEFLMRRISAISAGFPETS